MSFSLNELYRAVNISKQAFHKHLERLMQRTAIERQVVWLIEKVRENHPGMSSREIYFIVRPEGVGRDKFELICKEAGLNVKPVRRYYKTTDSRGVTRFDNLIAGLAITKINQIWQSDITYYEVNGKFYYLTFIQDAYSKVILGHATSKSLSTENTTLPALKLAIKMRRSHDLAGLIFHSDGGGQYYDKEFLALTKKTGAVNSMCEAAWENGLAESLNGIIKNNYLRHRHIRSYEQLVEEVDRTVSLYNHEKPHSRLNRKTPIEFEKLLSFGLPNKSEDDEVIRCKTSNERGIEPQSFEPNKSSESECILAIKC
jgi:putative transposase